jgi:hypothetical protein
MKRRSEHQPRALEIVQKCMLAVQIAAESLERLNAEKLFAEVLQIKPTSSTSDQVQRTSDRMQTQGEVKVADQAGKDAECICSR